MARKMRLAPQRGQQPFQLMQGGARQAQHLAAFVKQLHLAHAQGIDDHHRPIVVGAIGGRATGQAGIGRLHDDDDIGRHAGDQYPPLFDQRAGPHHCQHRPAAEAESSAEPAGGAIAGEQVAPPDHPAQRLQQGRTIE